MSDTIPTFDLLDTDDPTRIALHAGLTWKEAKRHGLTRRQYLQVVADARIIQRHHTTAGTPEGEREPLPVHAEHIVSEVLASARTALEVESSTRIDPKLDRIEQAIDDARDSVHVARDLPGSHRTKEAGTTHTGAVAAALIVRSNVRIAQDNAASMHHHRRHHVLRIAGLVAPWLDVIGLIAFATWVLNVELFNPAENWLAWLLAVAVVVGVGLASSFVAIIAGHAHNDAREALANGHVHEAEARFRRRNIALGVLTGLAALLAATLFARAQGETGGFDDSQRLMPILLAVLAVVSAFGLLAIAYLGAALDGSRLSRDRDALTKSLAKDFEQQQSAKGDAAAALDSVTGLADQIRLQDAPGILEDAQSILLTGRQRYERTRLHIGDVVAEVSPVPHRVIRQVGETWQGELSTGVPGASTVALEPLLDRETRLRKLLEERDALRTELQSLPAHPWTTIGSQV